MPSRDPEDVLDRDELWGNSRTLILDWVFAAVAVGRRHVVDQAAGPGAPPESPKKPKKAQKIQRKPKRTGRALNGGNPGLGWGLLTKTRDPF
jgi:hypothetical protein